MEPIKADELNTYRLVKITYGHDTKTHKLLEESIPALTRLHSNTSTKIRRRNTVADWVWAPQKDIEAALDAITLRGARYKTTDHTEAYFRTPEKISALRREIDEWMVEHVDSDTVLDRLAIVGMCGLSKIEMQILDKKSKSV